MVVDVAGRRGMRAVSDGVELPAEAVAVVDVAEGVRATTAAAWPSLWSTSPAAVVSSQTDEGRRWE